MIALALNALLFYAGWFLCVMNGAAGRPWTGFAIAVVLAALQLPARRNRIGELKLLLALALLGNLVDALQWSVGLVQFSHWPAAPWPCPPWITGLWVLYGTTLNASLRWLRGRPGLAAALGAVSGPLSYYAGARLGAATLHPSLGVALAGLAVSWSIAVPLTVLAAERLTGGPRREVLPDGR